MLINDDVVEVNRLNRKMWFVYWSLGNKCTYSCSYCPEEFHSGSQPFQFTNAIKNTLNRLPPSFVMFTGGEPTYHPDFEDIVLNKPDHIKLALISNGSRPYSFWERIGDQISYLILTFHPEFAKIDRFVDVARLMMVDKNCEGRINLIMHPEHWDYCIEAYNKLMEAGVTVSAKPLMDSFGDGNKAKVSSTYTQDELDWIAERNKEDGDKFIEYLDKDRNVLYQTNAAEMLARGDTNFKGWECHATTQTLTIGANGHAFSMTCGQGFPVGGIYTGFKLPTESVICRQNSCWCHYDIAATKNRVIPIIPQ